MKNKFILILFIMLFSKQMMVAAVTKSSVFPHCMLLSSLPHMGYYFVDPDDQFMESLFKKILTTAPEKEFATILQACNFSIKNNDAPMNFLKNPVVESWITVLDQVMPSEKNKALRLKLYYDYLLFHYAADPKNIKKDYCWKSSPFKVGYLTYGKKTLFQKALHDLCTEEEKEAIIKKFLELQIPQFYC